MEIHINMPVIRKKRRRHIEFYRKYLGLEYRQNCFVKDGLCIHLCDCTHVINPYLAGDQDNNNWISLFTFVIDQNFPSLCLKMKEEKVKFIHGIRVWTSAMVMVLDPSGNIIAITCLGDEDDNGASLDDLDLPCLT